MKRAGTIALLLALLAVPTAQARIAPPEQRLATYERIADAYWHHAPLNCPLRARIVPAASLPSGTVAEATAGSCDMRVSAPYFPARDRHPYSTNADSACYMVVHEWGHMVLGPNYFATTNPADPAHSADPSNVMYASGENANVPACVTTISRYRVGTTHRHAHKARAVYGIRATIAGVIVAEGR
jgi:hypothetical protein